MTIKVSEYVYKNIIFIEHVRVQKTIEALYDKVIDKINSLKFKISSALLLFADENDIDYEDVKKTLDIVNRIILPFKNQKIQAIATVCTLYMLPKHIRELDDVNKDRLINVFVVEHNRASNIYKLYSDYIKYVFACHNDDIVNTFISLLTEYYKEVDSTKDYHYSISFVRTVFNSLIKDMLKQNPDRIEM